MPGQTRITADNAPAILWVTEPTGSCTYLSRQWYELTGQAPDEGLGFGWLQAVHPDDRAPSAAIFAAANERRAPFTLDYRLRRTDGEYRWAIDAGQPRFSAGGRYLGFVGSVLDITERKRAERALQRSEEYFRALIEKSADLIAVLDSEGSARYVSPSYERILGYRPSELRGCDIMELLHPESLHDRQVQLERLSAIPGAAVVMEVRARHADGSWRRLQAHAVNRLDDPAVGGIVVNARDVTEQRRAEERLLHVTATSPAILYTVVPDDESPRASWVSSNIEEIMGYSVEEALAPGWWQSHLHPDDSAAAAAALKRLLRTGYLTHEYRFRRRSGGYRWIRDQLRVIRGADGRPAEIVGSWMDATEFRELEVQYHQAQKLEAIGRLAGGIAHDFNNVLTAILGFASAIVDDLDASHPLRSDAEEIVRASERGASLVRQLMAFSRQQVIEPQVISPNAVVSAMDGMLRRLIGDRVTLVADLDPACGAVRAEPGQLEQVLMNLVVNARDALPEGGRITITTARKDVPENARRSRPEVVPGRYVVLSVADTGCGMTQEQQAKIFEPFFTTKDKEHGTGLGLSIVYGIVTQAGGHVQVESGPGEGATFDVCLPEVESLAAPTPQGPSEVPGMAWEGRGSAAKNPRE